MEKKLSLSFVISTYKIIPITITLQRKVK